MLPLPKQDPPPVGVASLLSRSTEPEPEQRPAGRSRPRSSDPFVLPVFFVGRRFHRVHFLTLRPTEPRLVKVFRTSKNVFAFSDWSSGKTSKRAREKGTALAFPPIFNSDFIRRVFTGRSFPKPLVGWFLFLLFRSRGSFHFILFSMYYLFPFFLSIAGRYEYLRRVYR